jgi:hypothetical protein
MAMADGDVVVPFPSASIRNFNPYPSLLLTKKFDAWRWHIRHYGFHKSAPELLARLSDHVDELLEIEPDHVLAGLDVTQSERFASVEGEYDSDNKHEVEFTYDLIMRQQAAVPWRRIDILVEPSGVKGKLRLHDWPINKMQLPDCGALQFIDLLTDVLSADHGLELRRLPVPLSEAMVHSDAIGDEDRPSRLSFPKWSVDKNQFGEQVGTFFQNVRSRFGSTAAESPSTHASANDETGRSGSDESPPSFFQQMKSRLTVAPPGTISTEAHAVGVVQSTDQQGGVSVPTVATQHHDTPAGNGHTPLDTALSAVELNGVETSAGTGVDKVTTTL